MMKIKPRTVEIAPKVRAVFVPNSESKTSLAVASLLIPREINLGENILLPKCLCYSSAEYPSPIELNAKLEYLYGSVLEGTVSVFGESHLVELAVTCINNRYSLDGEDVTAQALKLLLGQLFEPDAKDGRFDKEKLEIQKRLSSESIESEVNRKRGYALSRLFEIMCADESFGITRQERLDSVRAATPESMFASWQELLEKATVQFSLIGDFDEEKAVAAISERFSSVKREPVGNDTLFVECAEDVTEFSESMDINQSKLVIGYRSGMKDRYDDMYAVQMMVDIFGGGPYSRLFKNVREKLSLCYYCSASLVREKGLIVVQSGIENANRQRVLDEVANQLEIMKRGEFTDEEFNASKTAICDALSGALDTTDSIGAFLSRKIKDDEILPIEESVARYKAVTREDVVRAANRVSLDTVYTLEGKGEGADE